MPKANRTNTQNNYRINILLGLFILLALIIVGRLVYWQIYRSAWLEEKAAGQWTKDIRVQPRRGNIIDCNGSMLAINTNADTITAIPQQIDDPEKAAELLSSILDIDKSTIYDKLVVDKTQVYLKRMVTVEAANAVRALSIEGIVITKESKRFYPNGSLASHALGFSGVDQGWSGLELEYDDYLQGTYGMIQFGADESAETDAVGYRKPIAGDTIQTTIDKTIQSIVELNLAKALALNQASSAMAIAMDVKTGGILAMSAKPDFDPNNYQAYDENLWRNPLTSDAFEPGSTFKIITMAAALEEGVIDENDRFEDPGYIVVAGRKIACWKYGGHGTQTYKEVIQNSCNPGFIIIGQKLGTSNLYKYIVDFGFTEKTNIDVPGEAKGIMFDLDKMGPVETATTSFGQGPAVTPIQQIRAVAAVANKGIMTTPHLVETITNADGEQVYQFVDQGIKQVISEETSAEMRMLLESVVSEGTGNRAYIEGYRIAGKTGTAQVPKADGGYYDDQYIASFIGFAPANDPQIALYVAIKNPQSSNGYYGGVIAAPLFGEMMKDILRYQKIPAQLDVQKPVQNTDVTVPEVMGMMAETAIAQLRAVGLHAVQEGPEGGTVIEQIPAPGVVLAEGQSITIKTEITQSSSLEVVVPDVQGLSMREAGNRIGMAGLRIEIEGSGLAVSQDPPADSKVKRYSVIKVLFE